MPGRPALVALTVLAFVHGAVGCSGSVVHSVGVSRSNGGILVMPALCGADGVTRLAIETRTAPGSGGETLLVLESAGDGVRQREIDPFHPPDGLSLVGQDSLSAEELLAEQGLFALVVRTSRGAEDVELFEPSRLPSYPTAQTTRAGREVGIGNVELAELQNEQCNDSSVSPYVGLAFVTVAVVTLLTIVGLAAWLLARARARRSSSAGRLRNGQASSRSDGCT